MYGLKEFLIIQTGGKLLQLIVNKLLNKFNAIYLLIYIGTIDKDFTDNVGFNFEICESAALKLLNRIKPQFDFKFISVCKKDSSAITSEDRLADLSVYLYTRTSFLILHRVF